MPSTPDRVETSVQPGLGVVHDRGDLEAPGDDQRAVVRPDGGGVVQRSSSTGIWSCARTRPGRHQSLGELLAQVVAPALAGLVVGDVGLARLQPPIPDQVPSPAAFTA
jgi:hypothetical protein